VGALQLLSWCGRGDSDHVAIHFLSVGWKG
jgi:hypothetical protein